MIRLDYWACLAVVVGLLALFVNYWILRLAVRGGIEDAARRQRARAAQHAWIRQQPPHEEAYVPQADMNTPKPLT